MGGAPFPFDAAFACTLQLSFTFRAGKGVRQCLQVPVNDPACCIVLCCVITAYTEAQHFHEEPSG